MHRVGTLVKHTGLDSFGRWSEMFVIWLIVYQSGTIAQFPCGIIKKVDINISAQTFKGHNAHIVAMVLIYAALEDSV